jgi:hypothetical protein
MRLTMVSRFLVHSEVLVLDTGALRQANFSNFQVRSFHATPLTSGFGMNAEGLLHQDVTNFFPIVEMAELSSHGFSGFGRTFVVFCFQIAVLSS